MSHCLLSKHPTFVDLLSHLFSIRCKLSTQRTRVVRKVFSHYLAYFCLCSWPLTQIWPSPTTSAFPLGAARIQIRDFS